MLYSPRISSVQVSVDGLGRSNIPLKTQHIWCELLRCFFVGLDGDKREAGVEPECWHICLAFVIEPNLHQLVSRVF